MAERLRPRRTAAVELWRGRPVSSRYGEEPSTEVQIALKAARKAARDQASAEARLRSTVQQLRAASVSWSVIGDAIGVSRSAAQQRFGKDALL